MIFFFFLLILIVSIKQVKLDDITESADHEKIKVKDRQTDITQDIHSVIAHGDIIFWDKMQSKYLGTQKSRPAV